MVASCQSGSCSLKWVVFCSLLATFATVPTTLRVAEASRALSTLSSPATIELRTAPAIARLSVATAVPTTSTATLLPKIQPLVKKVRLLPFRRLGGDLKRTVIWCPPSDWNMSGADTTRSTSTIAVLSPASPSMVAARVLTTLPTKTKADSAANLLSSVLLVAMAVPDGRLVLRWMPRGRFCQPREIRPRALNCVVPMLRIDRRRDPAGSGPTALPWPRRAGRRARPGCRPRRRASSRGARARSITTVKAQSAAVRPHSASPLPPSGSAPNTASIHWGQTSVTRSMRALSPPSASSTRKRRTLSLPTAPRHVPWLPLSLDGGMPVFFHSKSRFPKLRLIP